MPITPRRSPLSIAIIGLLDIPGLDKTAWLHRLDCDQDTLERIHNGFLLPSDQTITMILRTLEHMEHDRSSCDITDALNNFWSVVRAYESDETAPDQPLGLEMKDGESVVERLTRWTNDAWITNITDTLHMIPPENRQDFFAAIQKMSQDVHFVNKYDHSAHRPFTGRFSFC